MTGANFFPVDSFSVDSTANNNIALAPTNTTLGNPNVYIYNPAPLIVEAAEGQFQYGAW